MKLDPNLEKIRDVHIKAIKRGWLNRALDEARDYLNYMLNEDQNLINTEMNSYIQHLKGFHNSRIRRE